MNLNEIPKYVINLPYRTDRLGSFVREIHKTFENKDFTIIDGVIKETPKDGIWQAFKNCIQDAKDKNYSEILFMEDDVVFRDGTYNYAQECFKSLPEDWDILLGGIYKAGQIEEYNTYWNRIYSFNGGHFMVISSKIFNNLLEFEETLPPDVAFGEKNKFKLYVAKKFFALQDLTLSARAKMEKDYNEFLKKFELL